MPNENEPSTAAGAVYGRASPPKIGLPERGVVIGLRWSGIEGAGNQILAAKIECEPERARLTRLWRPFTDAPGRRDVQARFAAWLAEEARWAEGRLALGVDFALSLSETHLRQLGLLRQAIRGPAVLGRNLEERFLGQGGDFSEGAARLRAELGKDRPRFTDCYRAEPATPTSARAFRQTFFGLCTMARATAAFLPWDPPAAGKPLVVEVRPGHVARAMCGVCTYRDDERDGVARSSTRAKILRTLRHAAKLEFEMEQAAQIVEDGDGEHLDAVLSATGAAAAWHGGFTGVPANVPRCEGWIHSIREEPWREG
ncbi:DUF429 domain-containing protein [Anaeromyxobacter sp. PSR-1]|uniref:DUF429 domain-containing protein n=1 Tax=unclassified Anaeromyxobacter TaxID=2620896 RepID=UPI0005E274FF|nr:DUF429 domain-containing protein [Anaeromyxobacter sp. PSR-1]GAO03039.1 hypothetical protein PSR1_01916 [Anaeromyxobacter sp. PSR-1]